MASVTLKLSSVRNKDNGKSEVLLHIQKASASPKQMLQNMKTHGDKGLTMFAEVQNRTINCMLLTSNAINRS